MRELSTEEMAAVVGGSTTSTMCGIAVGATVGATLLFGGVGFALTANKAFALCTLAAFV